MAIVYQSGSVYADATGQLVSSKAKVAYIIFRSSAAGDSIVIRDGTSGTAPIKIEVSSDANTKTVVVDFSRRPMVFNDGIYLSAISASCKVTLVLTSEGSV